MTPCACRKILDRSAPWRYPTDNMAPPRDPDDDETEDEEDDDRNEELDPAVIREPDE
jgi:hypothetical protein